MDHKNSKEMLKLRLQNEFTRAAELESRFKERLVTLVLAALGVVSALFWQTAITNTIKYFIPLSGQWFYDIIVAVIVTMIAALVLYAFSKPEETAAKIEKK